MFQASIQREAHRQNLSGYRLAKLTGLPMRTIQDYLSGNHDLAGERVAKLASALGLELRLAKKTRPVKGGKK